MTSALYFGLGLLLGAAPLYWWARQVRGFLMEFGQHKGHCNTKRDAGGRCDCGMLFAVRVAFGHTAWKVRF